MASTESTVRAAVVAAIQAAKATLGLDSDSAIHDHLLDDVQAEEKLGYLMNDVSAVPKLRAVGVQVTADDNLFFDTQQNTFRTYEITIKLYYSPETDGDGMNRMIDAARAIRSAIKGIGTNLSSTVTNVVSVGTLEREIVGAIEDVAENEMVVGTMIITAQKHTADF